MPEKQKGIINTLTNLYSTADSYAGGVSLTVNKEDTSKSVLGSTITLLIVAVTFYMSSTTISNSFFLQNPTLSLDSEQGNENVTGLNYSNFFMSFSFFTPLSSDNKKFSNDTNNFQITETMSTLYGDCLNDCNNASFLMENCNGTNFDKISALKGLPINNSKNVTDLFKT